MMLKTIMELSENRFVFAEQLKLKNDFVKRVGIIFYHKDSEGNLHFLLILNKTGTLTTIGGTVDYKIDKNIFDALQREIREEIDFEIENEILRRAMVYNEFGIFVTFFVPLLNKKLICPTSDEISCVFWIEQKNIKSLAENENFRLSRNVENLIEEIANIRDFDIYYDNLSPIENFDFDVNISEKQLFEYWLFVLCVAPQAFHKLFISWDIEKNGFWCCNSEKQIVFLPANYEHLLSKCNKKVKGFLMSTGKENCKYLRSLRVKTLEKMCRTSRLDGEIKDYVRKRINLLEDISCPKEKVIEMFEINEIIWQHNNRKYFSMFLVYLSRIKKLSNGFFTLNRIKRE